MLFEIVLYIAAIAFTLALYGSCLSQPAPTAQPDPTPEIEQPIAPITKESAPKFAPAPALATLTIRTLKKLASERQIPRYSNLTKSQLVAVLST